MLAALFNTLLVFLVPRLMSVEQFGYWRLFLLYIGYVGFLHLGFADGALLSWAGKSFSAVHPEIGKCWKFLLLEHLTITLLLNVIVSLVPGLPSQVRGLCIGVSVVGIIVNSATLFQYSLQATRTFRPVAIAAAIPSGTLVLFAFIVSLKHAPTANVLMALYALAWFATLSFLIFSVGPRFPNTVDSLWSLGKSFVAIGWPVVLANTGLCLVQSADRLMISSSLPIKEFAQYSLAASTMFVPLTAIAAVSRVFFSHAAAVEHDDRVKIYKHMSRFLLISWSLLVPYFFVLEAFVRHFLPQYIPSLPVAAVLVISVFFLAGIQILHMSYFYLYGKQREFLYRTLGALALNLGLALLLVVKFHSLLMVAAGQVAALAIWWILNERALRSLTAQSRRDWLAIAATLGWSAAAYLFVLWLTPLVALRVVVFYGLVTIVLRFVFADEFRIVWRMVKGAGALVS